MTVLPCDGFGVFTEFLRFVYTLTASLYTIFRPIPIRWQASIYLNKGVVMDMLYLGAILALVVVICAFAAGCDKLGGKQ